jgi:isopenicillin N synthase-like dioxygenase
MDSSPISYADVERQIQQQAYAVVPFAVSRAEFNQAIDVFVRFLALPLETKEKIYFKLRPDDRGTEVGYKRYLRNEGQTDNREYVHYHRAAEEGFREIRQEIPELDELLKTMKRVHDEALTTLQKVIGTFEDRFPGISEKFFSQTNPGDFYLRFLKYDLARPGEFLAKGHYDRGSCTLALAESAPGLRMGVDDEHLHEVTHREGEALFMPGLKFPDLTSKDFVPTWHDVIQKSEDTYSDDIARWAIVFFADPAGMENISYEEAHTPKRVGNL